MHDEDGPLDDVVQAGAGGGKDRREIREDLFGLRHKITGADDLPVGGDRVLTADVDGSRLTLDDPACEKAGLECIPSGLMCVMTGDIAAPV